MTRTPWFAAYERPGRNGRVAAGPAMTREERNVLTIAAKVAAKSATVLDTVAEAQGDLS